MKLDLTDRFCASIKTTGNADYFDAKLPGLALRVASTGVKSWALFYTAPGTDKRARKVLGRYPVVTLAEARRLALEAKGSIGQGVDPRGRHARAMTAGDLIESYIGKHVSTLKSAARTERRLRVNVLPVIGSVPLAELHRRDINRAVDAIVARGALREARHTFDTVRGLVSWAVRRGDLDRDIMQGAGAPPKGAPRERFLTDDEIRELWHAWGAMLKPQLATILRLCLATGQRVGEVCGMTRAELDLDKRVWTLPASRTKNGHAHQIPLSDLAIELIGEAKPQGDRIFPKARAAQATEALCKLRGKLPVLGWTAHDLRRTAATKMAELGVSPIVIGHVCNHRTTTRAGMTLAVYVQHGYGAEKRQALELWSDRLRAIIGGDAAKVLPLVRVG